MESDVPDDPRSRDRLQNPKFGSGRTVSPDRTGKRVRLGRGTRKTRSGRRDTRGWSGKGLVRVLESCDRENPFHPTSPFEKVPEVRSGE